MAPLVMFRGAMDGARRTALGIAGAAQLFRRNGARAEPRKARRFIFAGVKINRNAQINTLVLNLFGN